MPINLRLFSRKIIIAFPGFILVSAALNAQIYLSEKSFIDLSHQYINIIRQNQEIQTDLRSQEKYSDDNSILGGYTLEVHGDPGDKYSVITGNKIRRGIMFLGLMNLYTSFPVNINNFSLRNNISIHVSDLGLMFEEDDQISIGSSLLSWETDFRYFSIRSGLIYELPFQYISATEEKPAWFERARFTDGYLSLGIEKLNIHSLFDLESNDLSYLHSFYTFKTNSGEITPYLEHAGREDSYHPGLKSSFETTFNGKLCDQGLLLTPDLSLNLLPFGIYQGRFDTELDITSFYSSGAEAPAEDIFIGTGITYLSEYKQKYDLWGWNWAFGRRPRHRSGQIVAVWFQYSYNDIKTLKQFNQIDTHVFSFFYQASI